MHIDFKDLPKNSDLFLDYIDNFENVANYYKLNFRDLNSYNEVFKKLSERKNLHKTEIVNILKNQYAGYKPSEKTNKNIELFSSDKTIAVFTGQQLGLLGGPMYTIYKLFTAIKLSEYLNTKFADFNFVPIFWMAGDDHDFEEISNLNIVSKENELKKVIYNDGNNITENRGSVGNLPLDKSIIDFRDTIKETIRETEFSKDFFKLIDNLLNTNLTIKESFLKLIFAIFDDTGLVIFNPQDSQVKKILKPIFKKELLDYKNHTSDLLLVSADLEENYHAQVKIKPINLFMSDETGRYLVEPIENDFRLKGKRKRITQEEMLKFVEDEPERFSANVLLRPICEDYLFPTGFYIAGPGEISYYAQAIPLYKHYGLQQPFIYPRASATIVEGNIGKILIKYNLSTRDFFNGAENLKGTFLQSLTEYNLDEDFTKAENGIIEILDLLSEQLSTIDNNLSNVSEATKNKIAHQLSVLKNKSKKAYENKFDSALRQITKAQNIIYPNNNMQERELGIVNFVNRYGFDFFDWLYNELDIREFKHQILEI